MTPDFAPQLYSGLCICIRLFGRVDRWLPISSKDVYGTCRDPDMDRTRPASNSQEECSKLVYRNTTGAALVDCVHKVIHGLTCVQRPADAGPTEGEDSLGARVRDVMTPKEMKIVALIMQGYKNRAIAHRLGNTEQVIKNHLRSVYEKAGVSDRLELALFTIQHPLLAEAAGDAGNGLQSTASELTMLNAVQMRSA